MESARFTITAIFLAISLVLRAGTPAAPQPEGILFARVGEVGPDQAKFKLVNSSHDRYEFLGGTSNFPIGAFNAEKLEWKDGCVKRPDIPGIRIFALDPDVELQFEYMDPKKVQVFGVFVRPRSAGKSHLRGEHDA